MTCALITVRVRRFSSMAATGAIFVERLTALAASTTAAENAAGITETGGSPALGAAWTGGGSDADKRQLQGSLVVFNDDSL